MSLLLNLIYTVAGAVLFPWLLVRSLTTGRYRRGNRDKLLGLSAVPSHWDASKPTIWFHGVSVGEVHLLTPVIAAFRRRHPHWQCVVSSTTDTGLAEARRRFADLPVVVWPFDFSWAVQRSLRRLRPQAVVLAESELWPNFLQAAQRHGIPVVVINGRVSPRSQHRLRKFAWLARSWLLDRVTCFAMQTVEYAQALAELGVPAERLRVTGSVKYDGVLGERQHPKTLALARLLGVRAGERIWLAGSTHAPEEKIVLSVFRKLRLQHPELRLILAPRHPERFEEVARLIDSYSFSYLRRSRLPDFPSVEVPAVILLDTIGELSAAWGLADVGFTGGSLDGKRGGQSMIEPAGFGVPVVFGPHVWNFRDAAQRLLEVGGAIRVEGEQSLFEAMSQLLSDAELRQRIGQAARTMVQAQQGATERTVDVLDQVLGIATDVHAMDQAA